MSTTIERPNWELARHLSDEGLLLLSVEEIAADIASDPEMYYPDHVAMRRSFGRNPIPRRWWMEAMSERRNRSRGRAS